MIKFALKRILEGLAVLFLIITAVFFMVRFVPGGPFDTEKSLSTETLNSLNSYYGLDKPIIEQYFSFLKNLLNFDLGPSYKYQNWSVGELIAEKAQVSLTLGAAALILALFFGLLFGFLSAARQNTKLSEALDSLSLLGICLPSFVLGPILILLFSIEFNFFNSMGWQNFSDIILPAATLAFFYTAWIAKLSKNSMLTELAKDYTRTQRAKGASEASVFFHAAKLGLLPTVSYLAPAAAGLLTGSFVVESIFQIPGLGRFFISSALDNDYTMIMGCVMLYSAFIIAFNIMADIAIALLNPKIAKEFGGRK